ncbi:MAG TPA: carboxypeptidase-like regulatory domain-containing protein [bacterium]|nr:carboxypeptidase-like regulatory domain-containing protein [bacterium]
MSRGVVALVRAAMLAAGLGASVLGAGCSSSPAKGAHVTGTIRDPQGTSIGGATIAVGGASTTSATDGTFSVDATSGTRHVHAEASGYYPTDADVPIAAGQNRVDLTLLPCAPGDLSCTGATPTPTPSATPTPPPGANIVASYDGLNYPGSGNPPAWTGTAKNNSTGTVWGDGGNGGNNFAFTECYDGGGFPLGPTNTAADIGFCVVDWVKAGAATHMGYSDAVIELQVDGATWAVAAPDVASPQTIRCSVELGTCSLSYAESTGGLNGLNSLQFFDSASAGVADITTGGYKNPQAVVVQNGAFLATGFP